MSNIFAPGQNQDTVPEQQNNNQPPQRKITRIFYSKSKATFGDHAVAALIGFTIGFLIMYIYYKIIWLAVLGGAMYGFVNIFLAAQKGIRKRRHRLRTQFFDLLEALSVAMRAGHPPAKALESARNDLLLLYRDDSDIIIEVDRILILFNSAVPLSESLQDFADRSGLEDIQSFASIYQTIEGKGSRADEIVRQTQSIISDKITIEMEIETLMTSAKGQMKVMQMMPILILFIMGYLGSGFMDSIYTTDAGRIAATVGLGLFVLSVIIGNKISSIDL